MRGRLVALALGLGLVTLAGCEEKPRAPALLNEAIFRQDDVGLRFPAPEGWNLSARSALPPGPLNRPMRLAEYTRLAEQARADFEVYAVELKGQDLLAYLAKDPIGPEKWEPAGPPSEVPIAGQPAQLHKFRGGRQRPKARRDLHATARGERTYLFVTTYTDGDGKSPADARKSVEGVTWK